MAGGAVASHFCFPRVPGVDASLTSKYPLTTSGKDNWRSDWCSPADMTQKCHEVACANLLACLSFQLFCYKDVFMAPLASDETR